MPLLPSEDFKPRWTSNPNAVHAEAVLRPANILAFLIIHLSLKMGLRAHLVSRAIRTMTIPPEMHATTLVAEKTLMKVASIVGWVRTWVLSLELQKIGTSYEMRWLERN